MLKCLIAFILGWFVSRHMGNGFNMPYFNASGITGGAWTTSLGNGFSVGAIRCKFLGRKWDNERSTLIDEAARQKESQKNSCQSETGRCEDVNYCSPK